MPCCRTWRDGRLAGFFDWDMAGPVTETQDIAFAAFSWVPLHARHVVTREGFTGFGRRPQRLRLFLDEYGWTGNAAGFLDVVRSRVRTHAATIRRLAAAGDPVFTRMVERGDVGSLDVALAELDQIRV
jgi:hypothetical protein